MKLLRKYSRINFATSAIIFLLASAAFFQVLDVLLIHQVDEDLVMEQNEFTSYVDKHAALPETIHAEDEITTFTEVNYFETTHRLSTQYILQQNEKKRFRQIEFYVRANNKVFSIHIAKSLENTGRIMRIVLLVACFTLLLLLVANYIINRLVLQKLWQPFYSTMHIMQQYKIGGPVPPVLAATNIDEFTALNMTLKASMQQAERDYTNLKEFTENAAHEMQTPVAVIRSKMDVLIQDEQLSEAQSKIVQEAYMALQRLTKLNQALLLLNNIENRQFADKELVRLDVLIAEKVNFFSELMQNKFLTVQLTTEPVSIQINTALVDILLNNLLGNCIKHSPAGSEIHIATTPNALVFSNGPAHNALDEQNIFTRFYKGGNSTDEHGLGLAIVKEICLASNLKIAYIFKGGMHVFTIRL